MAFGDDFDKILAPYLVQDNKVRLKEALKQFTLENRGKEINYSDFFKSYNHTYFMQSDLVKEIRMSVWDDLNMNFNKVYTDAIIISNTCDISPENKHDFNSKQCLLAPLVDFNEYLLDLKNEGYVDEKLEQFANTIKSQLVSNIFYIPNLQSGQREYIVMLDHIFWFPTNELNSYIENIEENRISSLSLFGHYLFILKLSYHLCRLPEQCDREAP
jgi:hypothetical protein